MKKVLSVVAAIALFIVHRVVRAAQFVKYELLRFEVMIKSLLVVAIGGGLNTAAAIYMTGRAFEFNGAHLLELKGKFISGSVVALIFYLAKSPIFKQPQQQ